MKNEGTETPEPQITTSAPPPDMVFMQIHGCRENIGVIADINGVIRAIIGNSYEEDESCTSRSRKQIIEVINRRVEEINRIEAKKNEYDSQHPISPRAAELRKQAIEYMNREAEKINRREAEKNDGPGTFESQNPTSIIAEQRKIIMPDADTPPIRNIEDIET